jgi:predicted  nucleic acid-binding Zn-ribbon protein
MENGTNGNGARLSALEERIQTLKQKDAALRAQIAAVTVKRKKREFKEFERLKNIIGGALLASAAEDTDFAQHLRERLGKCAVVESDKNFLRAKGWLS